MAIHDIRSDIDQKLALNAGISSNTTTNGSIIDTANFDGGLMFGVMVQAYTDGTYNFTLEEGDDSGLSDAAAVPAESLIGSLADLELTAVTANGGNLLTIGIFSNKRYVRINAVSTSVTTGATVVAVVSQKGEQLPVT